jgi:hypothetical protein
MYFDGEIPDYRLIGTLNLDKTPETPDLSGLTRLDCIWNQPFISYKMVPISITFEKVVEVLYFGHLIW